MDQELFCAACGKPFTFSRGEQQFFTQPQFKNVPKRCRPCRAQRRMTGRIPGSVKLPFQETRINCANCGAETTVPFVPRRNRPVYCRVCFDGLRIAAQSQQP
jgi:CxxC-x17-CxxC domain-containing protein